MAKTQLDFGKTKISRLFMQMFVPTLLSMLFGAVLNIIDGIIVGRGIGSDALAAVNIAAPIYLITTGVALMFGSGASVVAAVELSKGNKEKASQYVTQSLFVALFFIALFASAVMVFTPEIGILFGGTIKLMPYIVDYMFWVAPGLFLSVIVLTGVFVLRLDGSPEFAMVVSFLVAICNSILDYLFVFPLKMGIKGAAIATSLSEVAGALCILYYLIFRSKSLHIYLPTHVFRQLGSSAKDIIYMIKLGFSTFIGEIAISCMMITGNYMFIRFLGEDGVAAFSVACYLFPLVFMFGNAIAQSAQPIISYNHGAKRYDRVVSTCRLSLIMAGACGLILTLLGIFFSPLVVGMFIPKGLSAYQIAIQGFPYYSFCFLLFALNLVLIGYFQSVEQPKPATLFMLLRGVIFIVPIFIVLPHLCGSAGLWLATPISELMTFLVIIIYLIIKWKPITS